MTLVNQSIFPLKKNNKPNIGALVIGQSPRPEIEAEFFRIAGNSANLVLRGALDALSRKEIDSLIPEDDADTLFTRYPMATV